MSQSGEDGTYVQIGTWLLPETYGDTYDDFTQTKMPTVAGKTCALYAKAEDARAVGLQWLLDRATHTTGQDGGSGL